MTLSRAFLLRSMPIRLAAGLVLLFSLMSLLGLLASYIYTQASFEQTLRADLTQDMAGFRAAPSAAALASLVEAEARSTDPERVVLSYFAPNGRHYGNALVARDADGYRILSYLPGNPEIEGRFLALTTSLRGGQLTVARSLAHIDALRDAFLNILGISLLPTVLVALSGGLILARRGARHVAVISETLDQVTSGNLQARVGDVAGWSDDLARIGAKVDQMARSQEDAVESLRQVSSDIAHDLKTPIQRAAVHLDDLSQNPDLSQDARAQLEKAQVELDGIVSIFHALLQLAQIESGSPRARFAAVDLSELCQTLCDVYEPAIAENGQTLICALPDAPMRPVMGDRTLLGQVLANLIENAMHHTPQGTTISIALSQSETHVDLSVTDNGPGIPEAERDLVLRRLYRLDRSRLTPGNGLGLSLVAGIALVHDATLTLEDAAPGLRVRLRFSA
ncbi:sensor histidine kinase [Roseovarius sp. 217]|uniref:sensor histidine kinase n=1 Tax=Roseovarius sp. (strain 217) TaxID=314264 RepID=UPI0000684DCB|nr:HAMP domain-containing sensor histidine kinase [Roseovarius sp. 217]EAQ25557.1 sensory histidine protein kinase [Roseovarius sp. 217]